MYFYFYPIFFHCFVIIPCYFIDHLFELSANISLTVILPNVTPSLFFYVGKSKYLFSRIKKIVKMLKEG